MEGQAIVIDNGSGMLKAGVSGNDTPSLVIPSIVGRPRYQGMGLDFGFGNDVRNGSFLLKYPIDRGVVTDWDDMERIWHYVFFDALCINPRDRPCLLTESPLSPAHDREKAAQVMFETFSVPALNISSQASLPVYPTGRITGVSLNLGESVTYAVSVDEGSALLHTLQTTDLGGRDLTDHLMTLLQKRDVSLTSNAEKEIVRDAKEKLCYVAQDFEAELAATAASSKMEKAYELPDGRIISLNSERICCPEALFQPRLIQRETDGLPEIVLKSITKCEPSVKASMYANIILGGGSTMFPGIGERMTKEVTAMALSSMKVEVVAPPERKYSAWIGGSILSSLPTFQQKWITKAEYDESGASIVHHKCT